MVNIPKEDWTTKLNTSFEEAANLYLAEIDQINPQSNVLEEKCGGSGYVWTGGIGIFRNVWEFQFSEAQNRGLADAVRSPRTEFSPKIF